MTDTPPNALDSSEYIEQAYLFGALKTRLSENEPIQVLLKAIRDEVLATARLPMAIDYMLAELKHSGLMSVAMTGLPHYFTAFQAWLMAQAEDERGRMDMKTALTILEFEAGYRGKQADPVSLFLFQLEVLCRHRLSYDKGLTAMARDPFYNAEWQEWLLESRKKLGFVDIADLIYVHSEHYGRSGDDGEPRRVLFGEREGRIALANRRRDPLYLFSALQRQLGYPRVPERPRVDPKADMLPQLIRRLGQLEARLKLIEDEQKEKGIDLSQFYKRPE